MNLGRETGKMGVVARHREPARSGEAGGPARHASPPGNRLRRSRWRTGKARQTGHRATVPRYRGIGSEAYLNGTSQSKLVLSQAKEDPRTPGRTPISAVGAADS